MQISRAPILLLLLSLSLACSQKHKAPLDTLVTVLPAPIGNLDPLFATDANTQHINQLIHLGLVRISRDLLPVPSLAEDFRSINDTTIEFRLRKNCRFQNGREVVADDVEKTFQLYSDPKFRSYFQEAFKAVVRFEKLDNYTFRLHTKEPAPALLYDLPVMKIMPAEEYDPTKFQSKPVGAGAYTVKEMSPSGVLLERYDNGCTPLAAMPKIQVKVVRDDLSRFLKLKNGEVDVIMNDLDTRKARLVLKEKTPGLRVTSAEGTSYSYMGINFANPHLKKPNVRRAIALALDIPAIVEYKIAGFASPTATVIAPNSYFHADLPKVTRNLAEAKRLLDLEGYGNGENGKPPLRLTIKTTTFKPITENARAIVEQLRDAGIQAEHKAFEWGTFYGDVKARNTELFLLRWVGIASPDILTNIFHSKHLNENNRTNYVNPKVDSLLDAANSTLDSKKRQKLFLEVQGIIAEDLPYVSLWHNHNFVVYRDNLQLANILPTGDWDIFLQTKKIPLEGTVQ